MWGKGGDNRKEIGRNDYRKKKEGGDSGKGEENRS
jgi:hypothetical protein